MPVDFVSGIGGCEGEGVEGVVDAGCVEGWDTNSGGGGGGGGGGVVELREVKAAGFFGGWFGACAFGGRVGVLLFGGEEGVFFSFLAGYFLFLLLCFFPEKGVRWKAPERQWREGLIYLEREADFLAFDFAPLLHSWSSATDFFAFSAAALWLAASAFLKDLLDWL